MKAFTPIRNAVVLLLAASLAAGPALAEKPDWAGGGGGGKGKDKGEKHQVVEKHEGKGGGKGGKADKGDKGDKRVMKAEKKEGKGKPSREAKVGAFFTDSERSSVRTYYTQHYGGGKGCPPGLAKKNNGCLPPGQAKKYAIGQPLPTGVVFYPVPSAVLVTLPVPPVGHKYVRVAADILLIAVGTSMVVDAMTDLARL
jgi:Ni/Co efflux regulator RcnB